MSRRAILAGAAASAVLSAAVAATLPVRTDFARLLPSDAPSVVALHALAARMPSTAVIEVGVASDDARRTEEFAGKLAAALRQALPEETIDDDDATLRKFVEEHRWQLLRPEELRKATARANPLFVDLDEQPSGYVGEEGRLRMILVRAPFGDSEPEKGKALLDRIRGVVAKLPAPGVEVGYAGDVVTAALEHDLVLRDVAITAVLCLLLVFGVLRVAFRSARAVLVLAAALAVGCAWTFAFARLAIGELNSATAFLGPMVAGNGINAGIILLSRYLEERRSGLDHGGALSTAIRATLRPTLLASACAAAADLTLLMTRFRAFSEFGAIAAAGMALCWIATYTVLPPLLGWLANGDSHSDVRPSGQSRGDCPHFSVAVLGGVATLAIIGAGLHALPLRFQDDLRSLRSRSLPQSEAGIWSRRLDASFGRNQAGGFFIGTQSPAEVREVLAKLHASKSGIFGKVDALPELLPPVEEQRRRTDRPPVRPQDLPPELRRSFTEKDGRIGLLLVAHPGPRFDGWSVSGIRKAVGELRSLDLPPDVQVSGPEVIFADMMREVETALPRAALVSAGLAGGLLLLMMSIESLAGLLALAAGLLGMIAGLGLLHVRLDFLSALAVPITIGIAGDYPLNMLGRLRHDRLSGEPWRGLRQTGAAVLLCSLTTAIGYAVLLVSDTGAIRSFGLAALLGEASCLFAALVLAPALARLVQRG